jgi:SAM-dependent methyltransferase
VIDRASIANGQSVLDVGCGFGGTIARINETHHDMQLTGVNVDQRQIDICRTIASKNRNVLSWQVGDATQLTFADATFDRVFCVEAMFHFSSRRRFFAEASRVMKPGAVLAGTDIVISPSARAAEFPIGAILHAGFGPWPDVWNADADHVQLARSAGLSGEIADITTEIAPSHRYTAPPHADIADAGAPAPMRASVALRWLQQRGWLRYILFRFERPGTPEAIA